MLLLLVTGDRFTTDFVLRGGPTLPPNGLWSLWKPRPPGSKQSVNRLSEPPPMNWRA